MAARVPSIKFNNGHSVPVLGLGTWKSQPGEVVQAVKYAIDIGYRHIDCAHLYGNEQEVGQALEVKLKEGKVTREELFITCKLWNAFHRPDLVIGAVKKTLADLKLAYLDLYLVHWPHAYKKEGELFPADILFSDVDFVDTWKEMEKLVEAGLLRSIGVSNFNSKHLGRLLKAARIKPVTNQVECHPYLSQQRLQQFCAQHDIVLTAYSPLGSPDRPWAQPGVPQLLEDPKLKAIAERHGKTSAQVLIRFAIDRGMIVIPKSVNRGRIAQNIDVFDFKLSPEDLELMKSIDCNGRPITNTESLGHETFDKKEF